MYQNYVKTDVFTVKMKCMIMQIRLELKKDTQFRCGTRVGTFFVADMGVSKIVNKLRSKYTSGRPRVCNMKKKLPIERKDSTKNQKSFRC